MQLTEQLHTTAEGGKRPMSKLTLKIANFGQKNSQKMAKNLFHPLHRIPCNNLYIFHVSHFKLENLHKIVKISQKPFSPALSSPLRKSTY